ncbi:hypothetical protein [Bradyrhizobium sp. CCBAU 45389]|uniref:hypothetical protein n=1 Tax=Bradyrhizobium sp. CCBAU 45389 TaxID=858429 RepID=UPI00230551E6|nr:hypothetical protein [Bradyrhizobium sp. CCBAU 45389]
MVIETSLTMVLAEPPLPPDPELPPADCDDDVADVDDVAEVDEAADVEEAAEDDAVAVDGVVVTAALADAIALIDMKTSKEPRTQRRLRNRLSASTRRASEAGAGCVKNSARHSFSRLDRSNQTPPCALQLLPTCPGSASGCDQPRALMDR